MDGLKLYRIFRVRKCFTPPFNGIFPFLCGKYVHMYFTTSIFLVNFVLLLNISLLFYRAWVV